MRLTVNKCSLEFTYFTTKMGILQGGFPLQKDLCKVYRSIFTFPYTILLILFFLLASFSLFPELTKHHNNHDTNDNDWNQNWQTAQ